MKISKTFKKPLFTFKKSTSTGFSTISTVSVVWIWLCTTVLKQA